MFKYLAATLTLIFLGLSGIYFLVGVPRIEKTNFPRATLAHLYNNPDVSIANIHIFAFYFVPKNKSADISQDWGSTIASGLDNLKRFHELQLQKRSQISYKIFPEPVIGEHDSIFYNTENTDRGNPFALINISKELQKRVFNESGDLYLEEFKKSSPDDYPVIFVMYEGVGSTGGIINESEKETATDIAREFNLPESVIFIVDVEAAHGFFLVNKEIITGRHGPNGQSIMAHEFYHTIGLPDKYSLKDGVANSADIMGLGRFKLIENTYLSKELLAGLGL